MNNRNYTYYYQVDEKWTNEKMNNTNSTIGKSGCAISCIGMIVKKSPSEVNKWLQENKGYQGDLIIWSSVKGLGLNGGGKVQPGQVIKEFDSGHHVILKVKGHHFVVMTGYNGNSLNVMDPGHKDKKSYELSEVNEAVVYY